jgi:hypothetical protein
MTLSLDHKNRRFDDPPEVKDHNHVRHDDEVTFEVLTEQIRNHKSDCNKSISDQFDQWAKQFITWNVATYFFVAAVMIVAGATWVIRDSIEKVKDAIPISSDLVNKVNFTADKISIIEKALITKTDSLNKDVVERAVKILRTDKTYKTFIDHSHK